MFPRALPQPLLLLVALSLPLWPCPAIAQWRADGVPVCTAPGFQTSPRIVPDGAGGTIIAWTDARNGNGDIYAQRVRASGAVDRDWPVDGLALCTAPGDQFGLEIVADGAGGAIVAWHDGRSGTGLDIYAQHVLASGAVDPRWPSGGRALCTAPGSQSDPAMASDGAGGAIVVWQEGRGIYAQRVLGSGVVDPAWPADGLALCTAPGGQFAARILADGAGGVLVAWDDHRSDDFGDVYAHHVLASGVVDPAWPTDGLAVSTAPEGQASVRMVGDGAGGAILTWTDTRSADGNPHSPYFDIYAHHVLASGVVDPAWPADGLAICTAPEGQFGLEIAADRAGGAIVAWTDLRSRIGRDIYAQHVLASGTVDPAWPADGLAICTAPRDQSGPAIVADGTGGAIIFWNDGRSGTSDIYAQHVRGWGALDSAWPTDGRALSAAVGEQSEPSIAADGAGRAVVAWRDYRNGPSNPDIYARRVHTRSHVATAGPGRAPTLELLAAGPGLARGDVTLRFAIPATQQVSLEVFDAAGRAVRTLVAGQEFGAGTHSFVWDGSDHAGLPLKRGVYLVRLSAEGRSVTRKLLLLQ